MHNRTEYTAIVTDETIDKYVMTELHARIGHSFYKGEFCDAVTDTIYEEFCADLTDESIVELTDRVTLSFEIHADHGYFPDFNLLDGDNEDEYTVEGA